MFLLQQQLQDQIQELLKQQNTMYISVISALWIVIIAMAVYIRKLHNDQIKRTEEHERTAREMVEKNTEALSMMSATITANTTATKSAAEQTTRSSESLRGAIENLNRDILNKKP
jgi:menaquinone-dependent protoporphyrinogen IX oxidase